MDVLPGPSTVELRGAVAEAVAGTCAKLTGPVLGNAFDLNFGFSGARKLTSQLRALRTSPDVIEAPSGMDSLGADPRAAPKASTATMR